MLRPSLRRPTFGASKTRETRSGVPGIPRRLICASDQSTLKSGDRPESPKASGPVNSPINRVGW
jgi:hypothetical protein